MHFYAHTGIHRFLKLSGLNQALFHGVVTLVGGKMDHTNIDTLAVQQKLANGSFFHSMGKFLVDRAMTQRGMSRLERELGNNNLSVVGHVQRGDKVILLHPLLFQKWDEKTVGHLLQSNNVGIKGG